MNRQRSLFQCSAGSGSTSREDDLNIFAATCLRLIGSATVQPPKTSIQWITLPLFSTPMIWCLMFASPRERHSPEWRSATSRKTEFQLPEPSSLAVQSLLTPLGSVICRLFARSFALLALFFDVVFFVFSNLQPLFAKCRGGMGIPNACKGHPGWGIPFP
jgi:hypothetical protein